MMCDLISLTFDASFDWQFWPFDLRHLIFSSSCQRKACLHAGKNIAKGGRESDREMERDLEKESEMEREIGRRGREREKDRERETAIDTEPWDIAKHHIQRCFLFFVFVVICLDSFVLCSMIFVFLCFLFLSVGQKITDLYFLSFFVSFCNFL